ncbi:MAG TPA: GH25 family lysozyme [Gaiellaceae bacterium]|nr:GH25 family lysozyme [Gaiellaceae bacterium]
MSSSQGTIDWSQVAASGIAFGYARVADGTTFVDPDFSTNLAGMKAAGLKAGGYLFFEPNQDPVAQANALVSGLEQAGFGPGDLVPMLDVEVSDGQSESTVAANLQTAGNRIHTELGVYPLVYTSASGWNTIVGSSAFGSWPLWIANWNVSCPSIPSSWSAWELWQYADNGSVPGISTAVDQDRDNGSLPIWSPPDGVGTMRTRTHSVRHVSTRHTIVFTYTAASVGIANGTVTLTVPSGWSAPSLRHAARGHVTASEGGLSLSGRTIKVSGLTLAGGATLKITYGSKAGGGGGATAPKHRATQKWRAQERSSATGTQTPLAASPSIAVR